MKLATTTGDFFKYTHSQEKAMQYISESGFRYLDYSFELDYKNRAGVFSKDWKTHINNIKRLAESLSVTFIQAHSPMGYPIILYEKHDEFIAATKHCIACCAELGIQNIVVHSGYDRGITKQETFEKNKVFYKDLLEFAEQYHVNILTENFNRMSVKDLYWIDSAKDLKELISYVDHPLFHACWDVGHGNMQELPQDEALRILGTDVYALHVQDNLGDQDTHNAPYFGTTNLDSLMHGLLDIGYKGYFTFESNHILPNNELRRPFEKDNRLRLAPLGLRIEAEKFLYEIGRYILLEYDCFEE